MGPRLLSETYLDKMEDRRLKVQPWTPDPLFCLRPFLTCYFWEGQGHSPTLNVIQIKSAVSSLCVLSSVRLQCQEGGGSGGMGPIVGFQVDLAEFHRSEV